MELHTDIFFNNLIVMLIIYFIFIRTEVIRFFNFLILFELKNVKISKK